MTKPVIIILGLTVGLLTGILIVSMMLFSGKKETTVSVSVSPTPVTVEEKTTWKDQSGFTVQYPISLRLNPHDEDKENYAHLELTSATHSGSLIVWAKDTTAATIADFVKIKKIEGAIDTTLGGETAKKVLDPDTKQIVISAIKNGYLYQVEVSPTDGEYWNQVFSDVSSSFKFNNEEKAQNTAAQPEVSDEGQGDYIGGGEEVIE
jgi:hypothetical protein